MGERLAGSQKVRGSSPLSSTLPSGNKPQDTADPGKSGVFFCAGKSACDPVQPLARTCCVVLCVTLRRSFSPVSFVVRSISAARATSAKPGTHFPDISPSIRLIPLQQPHDLLLDLAQRKLQQQDGPYLLLKDNPEGVDRFYLYYFEDEEYVYLRDPFAGMITIERSEFNRTFVPYVLIIEGKVTEFTEV